MMWIIEDNVFERWTPWDTYQTEQEAQVELAKLVFKYDMVQFRIVYKPNN